MLFESLFAKAEKCRCGIHMMTETSDPGRKRTATLLSTPFLPQSDQRPGSNAYDCAESIMNSRYTAPFIAPAARRHSRNVVCVAIVALLLPACSVKQVAYIPKAPVRPPYVRMAENINARSLTSGKGIRLHPFWSKSDNRIYFSGILEDSDRDGKLTLLDKTAIWSINKTGGPPLRETRDAQNTFMPRLDPLGHNIVYRELTGNGTTIRIRDLRTGHKLPWHLTGMIIDAWPLPDGSHFIIKSFNRRRNHFTIIAPSDHEPSLTDRQDQHAKKSTPVYLRFPRGISNVQNVIPVAENSFLVQYLSGKQTRFILWDRSSNTAKRIFRTFLDVAAPSLSPDGRYLAFHSAWHTAWPLFVEKLKKKKTRIRYNLFAYDTLNRVLLKLTQDGGRNPAWSPDGRRIVYVHRDNSGIQLKMLYMTSSY